MTLEIGIIGSGIAGLSAAWYLGEKHHVTVFEKGTSFGLGQKGEEVTTPWGKLRLDIPPRVINRLHYPTFFDLIKEVDLDTYVIKQAATFLKEVRSGYLFFGTLNTPLFSASFPKLSWANALWLKRHGKDLVRFFHLLWFQKLSQTSTRQTLGTFLKARKYDDEFMHGFLYPMWALMCTCSYDDVDRFPARDMLILFKNFTSHAESHRLKGGTKALEEKLAERISTNMLETEVERITTKGKKMVVHASNGSHTFDHVIIATEPSLAIKLLPHSFQVEKNCLGKIPFYDADMILHTDVDFMPKKRADWAPVNLFWNEKERSIFATMWMNKLEDSKDLGGDVFQSWNLPTMPKDSAFLAKRRFRRSLLTPESNQAMTSLRGLMRRDAERRLWFVGSYVHPGVPLLENGVASSHMISGLIEKRYRPARPNNIGTPSAKTLR